MGIEPITSEATAQRSDRLSYIHHVKHIPASLAEYVTRDE
jgi:hypothetical protein